MPLLSFFNGLNGAEGAIADHCGGEWRLLADICLSQTSGKSREPGNSETQPDRLPYPAASACLGKAMEMSAAASTKALETHRQATSPWAWNTQPESSVPISRPRALDM